MPFSFVGLDFWEIRTVYLQGHRYVFGAIIYATLVVYTIYLQSRSLAVECLQRLVGVAKSYGFSLHRLRLDNGTVFHSTAFHDVVSSMGVCLEFSAP